MAEHPNLELVRTAYESFGKGDMETFMSTQAEDAVWHIGGDNPLSGDYRGHEEILGLITRMGQMTGGHFEMEIHDMLANDDHVVTMVKTTGSRADSDKTLSSNIIHISHPRDGKVTEFWSIAVDPKASDEFWS